jgi:WhiB family transcriptional regulator, redox-sensing transcriptional regulator
MYTDGTTTARPASWQERGECARLVDGRPVYDPEAWFPIGTTGTAPREIERAKAICWDKCTVRKTCLAYAMDNAITDGIFGGYSEDERKAMKRRDARQRQKERPQAEPKPEPVAVDRPEQFVPAEPTKARLQELTAAGYSPRDLAALLDIGYSTVRQILCGGQKSVTVKVERAVQAAELRTASQAVNA